MKRSRFESPGGCFSGIFLGGWFFSNPWECGWFIWGLYILPSNMGIAKNKTWNRDPVTEHPGFKEVLTTHYPFIRHLKIRPQIFLWRCVVGGPLKNSHANILGWFVGHSLRNSRRTSRWWWWLSPYFFWSFFQPRKLGEDEEPCLASKNIEQNAQNSLSSLESHICGKNIPATPTEKEKTLGSLG